MKIQEQMFPLPKQNKNLENVVNCTPNHNFECLNGINYKFSKIKPKYFTKIF